MVVQDAWESGRGHCRVSSGGAGWLSAVSALARRKLMHLPHSCRDHACWQFDFTRADLL